MDLEEVRALLTEKDISFDTVEKLPFGAMRNTYLITKQGEKYILKLYPAEKKLEVQTLVTNLIHLNSQRTLTLCPLSPHLLELDTQIGFMYPYFEGQNFDKSKLTRKEYLFGKIVGEFDKSAQARILALTNKKEVVKIRSKPMKTMKMILETCNLARKGMLSCPPSIINLFERGLLLAKKEKVPSLRIGFIHGDLHYENVLYNFKTKKYLIIDVFGMRYDFLVEDIAVILSHLISKSPTANKKSFDNVLAGYESVITLTAQERKSLPLLILLHKMMEVNWLINEYAKQNISLEVYEKYLPIDSAKLELIISHYLLLKQYVKK